MSDALRLLRPLQWVKNGLVFLPFLFAVDIAWSVDSLEDIPQLIGSVAVVFVGFCTLSSGVYVFNDLMDRNADRAHPRKRNRPIASGRVGVPAAFLLIAVLSAVGLVAMWFAGLPLLLVAAIYLAINVAYCLGGKNLVLLDVFAVASGYVIRGGLRGPGHRRRSIAVAVHDHGGGGAVHRAGPPLRRSAAGGPRR